MTEEEIIKEIQNITTRVSDLVKNSDRTLEWVLDEIEDSLVHLQG